MINLVIDVGNSRVKAGVFDDGRLVETVTAPAVGRDQILALATNHGVQNIIYSTVAAGLNAALEAEWKLKYKVMALEADTPLPIVNRYESPQTLGKDRLAAVVGAYALYPGEHCLVVDAGTCITTDLLTAGGEYAGGNIAPGIAMRLRAMHTFTARLPLVEAGNTAELLGRDTASALRNGGVLGAVFEIEGLLGRLLPEMRDVKVLLTGGDAPLLAAHLNSRFFLHPDLVLLGLDKILQYNG
jgi:type III pantothenate kinase